MKRLLFLVSGLTSTLIGLVGIFVPLLPTTPFLILAAFCFARSSPAWEEWMLSHPKIGPAIVAWRDHRAIPRQGKLAATAVLAASAVLGWLMLHPPLAYLPGVLGVLVMLWLLSRRL